MQGNQVGFESSLQQHLDTEQRRAVLEAIGGSINPDSTLGEIIDAAEALGWSDKMGDLSLADLAEALLAPNGESTSAVTAAASEAEDAEDEDDEAAAEDEDDEGEDAEDEDDDDDDDFVLEVQEPASRRKPGKAATAKEAKGAAASKKKAAAASASKKAASKKAVEEPVRAGKKAGKKVAGKPGKKAAEEVASKPGRKAAEAPARGGRGSEKAASSAASKKATSKKAGRRKPAAVDVDDRMSLDEAAEFFLPVVEDIGEATMQALEEQTGVSRRKLRFHVGQLVKHGYLERHGMGRGTYYTRR